MPALTSTDALILVTGASGFAACHIVRELIERGFRVRGTVRSEGKGDYLKKMFGDKFEYVIVKDVEEQDGHDEAVKDVECACSTSTWRIVGSNTYSAILHTASPFHFKATDAMRDLINPAVRGTTSCACSLCFPYAAHTRTASSRARQSTARRSSESSYSPASLVRASLCSPAMNLIGRTGMVRPEKPPFTFTEAVRPPYCAIMP